MQRHTLLAIVLSLSATAAWAGDKADAAIGGGAGGAVGAVIGDELGDRKGAIIGSAVGAAIGTAIATDEPDGHHHRADHEAVHVDVRARESHPQGRFCPPGQAKKGRC